MTTVAQMFHLMFRASRASGREKSDTGGERERNRGGDRENKTAIREREKGETGKQMRMRGVEKNISLRDAKFTICQPEVCAVPGVVVAVCVWGGAEGDGKEG